MEIRQQEKICRVYKKDDPKSSIPSYGGGGDQNCLPPGAAPKGFTPQVKCWPTGPQECQRLTNPQVIPITWNIPLEPNPIPQSNPNALRNPLDGIPRSVVQHKATVLQPLQNSSAIVETGDHPMCPDALRTFAIRPTVPVEPRIVIPNFRCPIRYPPKPQEWVQCVEAVVLNDQVRRPLARPCHKRELPPLVLSNCDLDSMRAKITEKERLEECCRFLQSEKDCKMLKSRYRHSLWNDTIESLNKRKARTEEMRSSSREQELKSYIAQLDKEKEESDKLQISRAQKLMLYRKGPIRDLHAAMALGKSMSEIEDAKKQSTKSECGNKKNPPYVDVDCMKCMNDDSYFPEYPKPEKPTRLMPEKAFALLKKDECRVQEREMEVAMEVDSLKSLVIQEASPWPEAYLKYIKAAECKRKENSCQKNCTATDIKAVSLAERSREVEAHQQVDAFLISQEKEIERQANEFLKYKFEVDRIRREKEQKVIDEKINVRERKTDQVSQQFDSNYLKDVKPVLGACDNYAVMKQEWMQKWEANQKKIFAEREAFKERVLHDHINQEYIKDANRRSKESCMKEYGKELYMAEENMRKECELKNERRKAAEEIAIYQKAQMKERHFRENQECYLSNVWDAKMKQAADCEQREMKAYGKECIKEWEEKKRNTNPMKYVMKKWESDGGVFVPPPPPFRDENCTCKKKDEGKVEKGEKCNQLETTASRLGFE